MALITADCRYRNATSHYNYCYHTVVITESHRSFQCQFQQSVNRYDSCVVCGDDDEEDDKVFSRVIHRQTRCGPQMSSSSGARLSSLRAVQTFQSFLVGTTGETFWYLWLDIERARTINDDRELARCFVCSSLTRASYQYILRMFLDFFSSIFIQSTFSDVCQPTLLFFFIIFSFFMTTTTGAPKRDKSIKLAIFRRFRSFWATVYADKAELWHERVYHSFTLGRQFQDGWLWHTAGLQRLGDFYDF